MWNLKLHRLGYQGFAMYFMDHAICIQLLLPHLSSFKFRLLPFRQSIRAYLLHMCLAPLSRP